MRAPYQPVDCSFHDLLESVATQRKPVAIVYKEAKGAMRETTTVLTDVYSRSGEEFVVCESGEVIRLDELVVVDGVSSSRPT